MRPLVLLATLVALLAAAAPAGAAPTAFSNPVDVSPAGRVAEFQFGPSVGMASDGRFAVAWADAEFVEASNAIDSSSARVLVQRFAADVTKVGGPVAFGPAARTEQPALAMAPDGRFAVAYRTYTTSFASRIEVQRFAADGTPQGGAVGVDPGFDEGGNEPPGIAMAADGRFAVAWQRDGSPDSVRTRTFAADGTPLNALEVDPTIVGFGSAPTLAMRPGGQAIVTWQDQVGFGSTADVPAQRINADGTALGGRISTYSGAMNQNYPQPAVGLADDGRAFAAFQGFNGALQQLYGRALDAAGTPLGSDRFDVTPNTEPHDRVVPDVEVDADGDTLVAYDGQIGTRQFGFLKQFSVAGAAAAGAPASFDVNPSGNRLLVSLDSDGAARSAVAYQRAGGPANGNGDVLVQRWDYAEVPANPPATTPPADTPPAQTSTPPTTPSGEPGPNTPPPAADPPVQAAPPRPPDVTTGNPLRLPPKLAKCGDRRKFTFTLHHPTAAKIIQVQVSINGKRALTKRAADINKLTLTRLPQKRFTVRIQALQDSGSSLVSVRTYDGCQKSRSKTKRGRKRAGR